ncbi:hypothetical protein P154DRAFT_592892 [Amniculicola lignicola CBS 123094]|uniref:Uncharacterized protein n=1 Tax=Amniculicola lignicola CBS 123094 TaxID=1392246 RepID=A0A6A5X3M1_9PLEO|nr:hypothetical protein P154DRAFT_592892 [Amniculicola lignicola CBS 123094]
MTPALESDAGEDHTVEGTGNTKIEGFAFPDPSLCGLPTEIHDLIVDEEFDLNSLSKLSRVNRFLHKRYIGRVFRVLNLDLSRMRLQERTESKHEDKEMFLSLETAITKERIIWHHTEEATIFVPNSPQMQPVIQKLMEGFNPKGLVKLVFAHKADKSPDAYQSWLNGQSHQVLAKFLAEEEVLTHIEVPGLMDDRRSYRTSRKRKKKDAALEKVEATHNLCIPTTILLKRSGSSNQETVRIISTGGAAGTPSHIIRRILQKYGTPVPFQLLAIEMASCFHSQSWNKDLLNFLERLELNGMDSVRTSELRWVAGDMGQFYREDLISFHLPSIQTLVLSNCMNIGRFLDHLAARGSEFQLKTFEISVDCYPEVLSARGCIESLVKFLQSASGLVSLTIQVQDERRPNFLHYIHQGLQSHGTTLRELRLRNDNMEMTAEQLTRISSICCNVNTLGIDFGSLYALCLRNSREQDFVATARALSTFFRMTQLECWTEHDHSGGHSQMAEVINKLNSIVREKANPEDERLTTVIWKQPPLSKLYSKIKNKFLGSTRRYILDGKAFVDRGLVLD